MQEDPFRTPDQVIRLEQGPGRSIQLVSAGRDGDRGTPPGGGRDARSGDGGRRAPPAGAGTHDAAMGVAAQDPVGAGSTTAMGSPSTTRWGPGSRTAIVGTVAAGRTQHSTRGTTPTGDGGTQHPRPGLGGGRWPTIPGDGDTRRTAPRTDRRRGRRGHHPVGAGSRTADEDSSTRARHRPTAGTPVGRTHGRPPAHPTDGLAPPGHHRHPAVRRHVPPSRTRGPPGARLPTLGP